VVCKTSYTGSIPVRASSFLLACFLHNLLLSALIMQRMDIFLKIPYIILAKLIKYFIFTCRQFSKYDFNDCKVI